LKQASFDHLAGIASAYFGHAGHHGNIDLHTALKSSGTSPNFLITLASLKSPLV
jgi:hypothetical protein